MGKHIDSSNSSRMNASGERAARTKLSLRVYQVAVRCLSNTRRSTSRHADEGEGTCRDIRQARECECNQINLNEKMFGIDLSRSEQCKQPMSDEREREREGRGKENQSRGEVSGKVNAFTNAKVALDFQIK